MDGVLLPGPQGWIEIAGYLAFGLLLLAFSMKMLIPLRLLAILSSAVFVVYALLSGQTVLLVGHTCLLLVNGYRTSQLLLAFRRVNATADGQAEVEALVPLMRREDHPSGTVLFLKGDRAMMIYYLSKGAVDIPELAKTLSPGTLFGEVGLFTPDRERTASAVCAEDCQLLVMNDRDIVRHCIKDPAFGLYLTKLIAGRMAENQDRPGSGFK